VRNAAYLARGLSWKARALRFTALHLRHASLAEHPGPHIARYAQRDVWGEGPARGSLTAWRVRDRLGALWRGCKVEAESVERVAGNSVEVHFGARVAVDGWFLVTDPEASPAWDPARFVVEVSEDGRTFKPLNAADQDVYLQPRLATCRPLLPSTSRLPHAHHSFAVCGAWGCTVGSSGARGGE
jgi:hypothetical protein